MKITLESTTKIVELGIENTNAFVAARIWEGATDTGIPVHVYIVRIATEKNPPENEEELKKELLQCRTPSEGVQAIPLRLII